MSRSVLASLIIELGADVAGFESDMKRAESISAKYSKQMESVANKYGKAIGAALATAAVGVGVLLKKTIDAADEMNKFAQKSALSVQQLSGLQYAAKQSGLEIDKFRSAVLKMEVAQAKAAGGSEKQAAVFRALGISVTDVNKNLISADKVLLQTADKMASMRDGAAKTALAMAVFGKAGADMVPFLNGGSQAILEMQQRAEALGIVMSDNLAAASEVFNDRMDDLREMVNGFGVQIAEQIVPGLAEMADQFVSASIEAGTFKDAGEAVGEVLKGLVIGLTLVKNTIEVITAAVLAMASVIKAGFSASAATIGAFADYVQEAASAMSNPFDENTLIDSQIRFLENVKGIAQDYVQEVGIAFDALGSEYDESVSNMTVAWENFDKKLDGTPKKVKQNTDTIVDYGKEAEKAAKEAEKLARAHTQFIDKIEDLRAELSGPMAVAINDYNDKMEEIQEALDKGVITVDEATEAQMLYGEQLKKTEKNINDQMTATEALISDLEFELSLIGLSNVEREKEIALRHAGAEATDAQRQKIEQLIQSIHEKTQADESSRMWAAAWTNSIGDVKSAFLGFIDGSTKNFEDFGDKLKDIGKRLLRDLVDMFLSQSLNFNGSINMNGQQGGGILNNILGMFTGGGGGFGGGAMGGGILGALGGIAAALKNPGNSAGASLGRIGSYAVGGYALGSVALGALSGGAAGLGLASSLAAGAGTAASAGALATGAVGGAAAGGASAAMAIPVAGWIVAAIAAIDMITGGKVFGTKYRPETGTSTLSVGANGGRATQTVEEVRQRALFGGRQWRTRSVAASQEMRDAATSLFDSLTNTVRETSMLLGAEAPALMNAAIRTVVKYTKKGKVESTKIFVDVLGRTWQEADSEKAGMRLTAEAILHSLDAAAAQAVSLAKPIIGEEVIGKVLAISDRDFGDFGSGGGGGGGGGSTPVTQTMSEIHTIAERWRSDAEQLLDGARFLLQASVDIKNGIAILGDDGTLTQLTDLVEELSVGNETLTETYMRLAGATQLFDKAIELAAVNMDMTREEIVRLATDIADAAGGLDAASALWNRFFQSFYDPEELIGNPLVGVTATRDRLLGAIGVDSDISMDDFRELFEERLPELSAEAIVEWLRAADALAAVVEGEAQLSAIRAELAARERNFQEFLSGLSALASGTELSQFQQDLLDIETGAEDLIAQYTELAIASGRAAPNLEELGNVALWSARQFDMAVSRLKARIRDLVTQLQGTLLDRLNSQIEAIEMTMNSTAESIQEVSQLNDQRYEQEIAYLQSLKEFRDSLLLSDLSPLNPFQQFQEAMSQYQEALTGARAGDPLAQANLQQIIQQLLQTAQGFLGPSIDYTALFNQIMADTQGLIDMGPLSNPGSNAPIGVVEAVPSEELIALYAQRDAMLLEQENAMRLDLATQIIAQMGELIRATGADLFSVIAEAQMDFGQVIADLGIDVMNLTGESVRQLGEVAQTLNVQLSELATNLNISLGELADSQSLVNDAFEGLLEDLPADLEDELRPLFEGVENATTEADANEALQRLRDAVSLLAPEIRNQLAPYLGLDQVDEETVNSAIAAGASMTVAAIEYGNSMLERIYEQLGGAMEPSPTPEGVVSGSIYEGTNFRPTQSANTSSDADAINIAANRIVKAILESAKMQASAAKSAERYSTRDRTV